MSSYFLGQRDFLLAISRAMISNLDLPSVLNLILEGAAELVGVLTIGTWTLVEPSAFPDATVWSEYGMGYLFIPVLLPLTALYWLRRARPRRSGA